MYLRSSAKRFRRRKCPATLDICERRKEFLRAIKNRFCWGQLLPERSPDAFCALLNYRFSRPEYKTRAERAECQSDSTARREISTNHEWNEGRGNAHRKRPRDLLTVRTVRAKGAWLSLISGSSLVKGDTARYARTKGFLRRGIAARSRHIVCSRGGDRETSRSGRETCGAR